MNSSSIDSKARIKASFSTKAGSKSVFREPKIEESGVFEAQWICAMALLWAKKLSGWLKIAKPCKRFF